MSTRVGWDESLAAASTSTTSNVSTIYCQRCATLNSIERSNCAQCGTPLLIVSSIRGLPMGYEEPEGIEEHLLERISALETEVGRLKLHNDRLLDLIHRQATTTFHDHALLDAIVSVLEERGGVPPGQVQLKWQELIDQYTEELDERERFEERTREILDAFAGNDIVPFEQLIAEGMELLLDGATKRGVRRLEKALLIDPENAALGLFLGEFFFFGGRRTLARHYLEQASASAPDNAVASLMLGVLCGDEGEMDSAREHFERALAVRKDSFVAHYGLGRLHAVEGRFAQALVHFKRALSLSPSPEMHYLVGRAYLAQERADIAERHLRKAVDLDPHFDAALYHLGLIYLNQLDVGRARECFLAATEANPDERRYRAALTAKTAKGLVALPVFGPGRITRKQSITSGDARFTMLLMQNLAHDALNPGHGARS
jgi:tetratricopeptide (TPR) repeat protein